MSRYLLAVLLLLLPATGFAAVPEDALDKDYQACLGGDSDSNRIAYCGCIRDTMRGWDMDTYTQMANQAVADPNNPLAAKLQDMAKQCIDKVLH